MTARRERWRAVYVGCAREEVFLLDVAEARQVQRSPQIQRRRRLRVIMGRVARRCVRRDGAAHDGNGHARHGYARPESYGQCQKRSEWAPTTDNGRLLAHTISSLGEMFDVDRAATRDSPN